jgi:uncharacterized protein YneF (UPF0154 family)
MKKLHNPLLFWISTFIFIGGIQGLFLSQVQHKKVLIERQLTKEQQIQKLFNTQDTSANDKIGRVLASVPKATSDKGAKKIAANLVKMVINPFKRNQEVIDAVKAISRYYTEGGNQNFGIKVDI